MPKHSPHSPFSLQAGTRWHHINCTVHAVHACPANKHYQTGQPLQPLGTPPLTIFLLLSITIFIVTLICSCTRSTTPSQIDGHVSETASAVAAVVGAATGNQEIELVDEPVDNRCATTPTAACPHKGPPRLREIGAETVSPCSGPRADEPSRGWGSAGLAGTG